MQEAKRSVQHVAERRGGRLLFFMRTSKADLRKLDIPVAEFRPDELAELAGRLTILMGFEQSSRFSHGGVSSAENPAVGDRKIFRGPKRSIGALWDVDPSHRAECKP